MYRKHNVVPVVAVLSVIHNCVLSVENIWYQQQIYKIIAKWVETHGI